MNPLLPNPDHLWSIEAEYAVLGSMTIDGDCISEVAAIITRTDMFYSVPTRHLFDAILALYTAQIPVDAVMLRTQLKRAGTYDDAGGIEEIKNLLNSVPSSANALYYAKVVREKYNYRQMLAILQQIAQVPSDGGPVDEQIAKVQSLALSLRVERDAETHTFATGIEESIVKLADTRDCLPTGFRDLDKIIHGFYPHEYIVIAGRPGHGKSCFCGDIAVHCATEGKRVIVFSLEMSAEAIMQRALCAMSHVAAGEWEGVPTDAELQPVLDAGEILRKLDISIYETIDTPEQMYAVISAAQRLTGADLVCIDNIQLMQTQERVPKEYDRLTTISRQLKKITQNLRVPVLCISHLNREVEKRNNHTPKLSDLRGSGGMEQDADLVLFLHREDQYRKLENPDCDPDKLDGSSQVVVAKNRRGKTGIASLVFVDEYTTFQDKAYCCTE